VTITPEDKDELQQTIDLEELHITHCNLLLEYAGMRRKKEIKERKKERKRYTH
jgi:hypothetical protein